MASSEGVKEERAREAQRAIGNGEQQGFTTGATRSTAEGKIDYEGHISPAVLQVFGEYMNEHRVQRDGRLRASDNWQKGIPVSAYMKSLVRHTFELWRMWRGGEVRNPDAGGQVFTLREVLCAILFNVMGIIFELEKTGNLGHTFVTEGMRVAIENGESPALPQRQDNERSILPADACKSIRERDARLQEDIQRTVSRDDCYKTCSYISCKAEGECQDHHRRSTR